MPRDPRNPLGLPALRDVRRPGHYKVGTSWDKTMFVFVHALGKSMWVERVENPTPRPDRVVKLSDRGELAGLYEVVDYFYRPLDEFGEEWKVLDSRPMPPTRYVPLEG